MQYLRDIFLFCLQSHPIFALRPYTRHQNSEHFIKFYIDKDLERIIISICPVSLQLLIIVFSILDINGFLSSCIRSNYIHIVLLHIINLLVYSTFQNLVSEQKLKDVYQMFAYFKCLELVLKTKKSNLFNVAQLQNHQVSISLKMESHRKREMNFYKSERGMSSFSGSSIP